MKKLFLILLATFSLACSREEVKEEPDEYQECRDIISNYSVEEADPVSGLIEGDIIPDKQINKNQNKAYVDANPDRLWEDNIVPFYFHDDLSYQKEEQIRDRMNYIESVTYIVFVEFEDEESLKEVYNDGIKFRAPLNPFAGNSSYVGKQGGIQNLTLVDSSTDHVIEHEIFHALGHQHEHTRPDRDQYIIVNYDNIPVNPFLRRQFDIREGSVPCGEYDVKSGMHYGSFNGATVGAIEDSLPAITTIEGELIPTPTGLSEGDIEANKVLYPEIE